MKKLITLIIIVMFTSCNVEPRPIENFGGSKYVLVQDPFRDPSCNTDEVYLKLKNKDTIFYAKILVFDAQSRELKKGDTIR